MCQRCVEMEECFGEGAFVAIWAIYAAVDFGQARLREGVNFEIEKVCCCQVGHGCCDLLRLCGTGTLFLSPRQRLDQTLRYI